MKSRSSLLLFLCVFVVGVFVGIWLDWSAWKKFVGVRHIVFQVQDYPLANVMVHSGDQISLVPPPGGDGTGLQMNFVGGGTGYIPCTGGVNSNPCVIDAAASIGPYLFTCSSPKGYICPEPGIQQGGSGPISNVGYVGFVARDFANLFGIAENPVPPTEPGPPKMPGDHPATSSVTAYVSCKDGVTVLNDPNGNPLTNINASSGQSVYWISPKPFTLDTSKFPAGLCSNGNPGSGSTQQAQCDLALSKQSTSYTVQAQTTPSCSALSATLKTN